MMNKLKGSSAAIKMKYLLFVFAAAVLVALPARVYQLLAIVDVTNGFYKESDITVPVLYAIVVVFGLLFLVLSFMSKEVPSPKLPVGKNPVLGVASFIMAAGLGWDIISSVVATIPGGTGNVSIFSELLRSNLEAEGGVFAVLQFVFAFFALIYFLVFAISHLNGRASYKEFKLLALAPLCWVMTMLVSRLMNAISFIKVSELLFELFMCVFTMLFFLTFARISSGVFTEDSMWGIYGYGLVAALLGALVTIPRIVIFAVGLNPVQGYEFDFAHLASVIFILAYVFASLGVGFKGGLKIRRTVNEIELPDDDVAVLKKDTDAVESGAFTVLTDVADMFGKEFDEEIAEKSAEEEAEEIVEAICEAEAVEEAEEALEPELPVEEVIAEAAIEPEEAEVVEEAGEEEIKTSNEYAPISLAELKSRDNKE